MWGPEGKIRDVQEGDPLVPDQLNVLNDVARMFLRTTPGYGSSGVGMSFPRPMYSFAIAECVTPVWFPAIILGNDDVQPSGVVYQWYYTWRMMRPGDLPDPDPDSVGNVYGNWEEYGDEEGGLQGTVGNFKAAINLSEMGNTSETLADGTNIADAIQCGYEPAPVGTNSYVWMAQLRWRNAAARPRYVFGPIPTGLRRSTPG